MEHDFKIGQLVHFEDEYVSGVGEILGFEPEEEQYDVILRLHHSDDTEAENYFYVSDHYIFDVRYFKMKDINVLYENDHEKEEVEPFLIFAPMLKTGDFGNLEIVFNNDSDFYIKSVMSSIGEVEDTISKLQSILVHLKGKT